MSRGRNDRVRHGGWRKSLRVRWNTAFALLLLVLLGGGFATHAAVSNMVSSINDTTEKIRERSELAVTLQEELAEIQDNAHSIIGSPAGPAAAADHAAFPVQRAEIEETFNRTYVAFETTVTRKLVEESHALWYQAMLYVAPYVDDFGPRDAQTVGRTQLNIGEKLGRPART